MLQKMCREQLSDADIKAICKSRGFSAREASSRAIFENFFLSDIGVAAALATLTAQEVATLRLLARVKDGVDVAFFARVYGDSRLWSQYSTYNTYNQRYSDVMKQAQTGLIRRGLLLYAEAVPDDGETTKLQRLRFRFPVEFEAFLPPLLSDVRTAPGGGEVHSEVLREKLLEIVAGRRVGHAAETFAFSIVGGELRMGQGAFRAALLRHWQQRQWEEAIGRAVTGKATADPPREAVAHNLSLAQAVEVLFAGLAGDAWAPAETLTPLLEVLAFGSKPADGPVICEAGWRCGCLARQEIAGQMCYRLAPHDLDESAADPGRYLNPAPDGAAIISLETIPYDALEQVAAVSNVQPASSGPYLIATPNLIRLGRVTAAARKQPALRWLHENAPAYREAFALAAERWGKQIIHTNLLVAHITDPALRVQIARALPDPDWFVNLSDEFVAFPGAALPIVEKAVTKAGYVVKTLRGQAEK
jgi:hypothetical protein